MVVDVTAKNIQNEKTKLLKASKVALLGMGIAILAGVFAKFVVYFLSGEANRIMIKYYGAVGVSSVAQIIEVVGLVIQIAILGGFLWLSFALRKSKSRAIAVNLIVFSSIFIVFNIIGIMYSFINVGAIHMIYKSATSQELQILRQSMYYAQVVFLLSIVAWAFVLTGGIIGVRSPESELEKNRMTN